MNLPERPNLRHLRNQARDLFKSGAAPSLTAAQFQVARQYGFPSWPKLKAHVDSLQEIGQLLRHRCALTTAIYAKANREALRTIARSWPGDVA